ncbi:MAG: N-acetylglucosamine-6-phosphate deacetylase [Micromonosporaceae bacterium]
MVRAVRGRVVTPDGVIEDGVIRIVRGQISHLDEAGSSTRVRRSAAWILPGFIDLHVHGGGGHTFTTGDVSQARAAAAFHAAHGTTTMLASLVAAPADQLLAAVSAYAPLVAEGVLAGVHLEGPYLSPQRCGAQNPAHLRWPELAELSALLDLGVVRMVTIAPELPGALPAIRRVVERGALAAVGHTDASHEQTRAAVAAGARVATHLCNGMRPIHHREPGPIVALLEASGVVCEVIADGVHLHEAMLRYIVATAGAARVALVTDAIAAAGRPNGEYELGDQPVRVIDGVARLAVNDPTGDPVAGPIAGSTLTMDAAVRRVVHSGVDIAGAARMAATTPATVLGRSDEIGAVAPGRRADLVLLDEELRVTQVLRAGVPVG